MECLDQEKLIADVRKAGYEIQTIDDLMKMSKENADLIPILLEHLANITDEGDKAFLARCLTVKGFCQATKPLIQEFYQMTKDSPRWAIGNALSIIADKSCSQEMVEIAKNRDFGMSRQMIVYDLWKFDDSEIKDVLVSLLNDETVVGHAVHALRRLGDPSVIPYLEAITSHKMTWIRNEAKAAIERLNKIKAKDLTGAKRKRPQKARQKDRLPVLPETDKVKCLSPNTDCSVRVRNWEAR